MIPENFNFVEWLKILGYKFLMMLQSRKFWAAVFAVLAVFQQLSSGAINAETAVWSIVTIVSAYVGFTAVEDGLSAKARTQ